MPVFQRASDDFDMSKLQKSLKKQQQRSNRMRHFIAKLSPAEIRSLNNNAEKPVAPTHGRAQKPSANTPPLTPEHLKPRQHSASAQSAVNLPTPPGSPEDSSAQRKNLHPTNGTHIHSPVPVSHHKVGIVHSNGSRPPSETSHRSIPVYRGNEVTRNGSLSMLRPTELTHQIVDNPLSQFSRPRQSLGNGNVSPSRQEPRHHRHSFPIMHGSITPPQSVKSYVSALDDEGIVTAARKPSRPGIVRAQTVSVDEPLTAKPPSRFSWSWRRTFLPQRNEDTDAAEVKKLRRRSITWGRNTDQDLKSIAYEDTQSGNAPEIKRSLRGDLPSDMKSTATKHQDAPQPATKNFSTHPAVRPFDLQDSVDLQMNNTVTASDKGKEREEVPHDFHDVLNDDSIPMYSRCSCCGKLKKQPGNRALSPVFENENLRTNISFEIEKTDDLQARRRSSSSGIRQKYTPIIPMVTAEGNTMQAKIGPKILDDTQQPPQQPPQQQPLEVTDSSDIIAQSNEPVVSAPKRAEDKERKIVRFSSLNLKGNQAKLERAEPNLGKEEVETTKPLPDEPQASKQSETIQVQSLQDVQSLSTGEKGLKAQQESVDGSLTPESIPEEVTGALMAAMSGIDLSFDVALPKMQPSPAGNVSAPAPVDTVTANSSPSNSELVLSDPIKTPTMHESVTTDQIETKPNVPNTWAEQGLSSAPVTVPPPPNTTSRPKSILKQTPRSSYNNTPRTSMDYTWNPPTTYVPPDPIASARGAYITRPKATARYMHVAPMEVRKGPNTTTSSIATTSVPPLTKSRPSVQAVAVDDSASLNGSLGRRNLSSEELSTRRLSWQSARSYSSVKTSNWLPRRQSNLVGSVLAATKQEKMSKFERAVSKV